MTCYMHIVTDIQEKVILSSEVSWQKFITSIHQWKSTDTKEAETKQYEIDTFGLILVRDSQILNIIPCKAWYHQKCYIRYTDKSKIEGVKKKPSPIPQRSDQCKEMCSYVLYDDVTF